MGQIQEKFKTIFRDIRNFSSQEKRFIFFAMLCGCLICADYALIRPVSNSLFIQNFSTQMFPYAWLATIPFNLLLVSLYNRFLSKWGCQKMFLVIAGTVLSVHLTCALLFEKLPFLTFFYYIWKEIYILLMFQQLWSVIHSTIKLERAKYLYGMIFGIGALGSLVGSFLPGFLAIKVGSESLLFFSLPIYVALIFSYRKLISYSSVKNVSTEETPAEKPGFLHGIQLIRRSRFLILILLLVVFMQISSSLVDFQFSHYLENTFPDKDLRTQFNARIFSLVHLITLCLQFVGSFLLIQILGVRNTHLFIPLSLVLIASSTLFFPIVSLIALSYIAIKSFDFSLFGIVKEMLYVPLKQEEKFKAKAVIDVFAYRTSKAVASIMILAIQFFAISFFSQMLLWITLGIYLLWITSLLFLWKRKDSLEMVNEPL